MDFTRISSGMAFMNAGTGNMRTRLDQKTAHYQQIRAKLQFCLSFRYTEIQADFDCIPSKPVEIMKKLMGLKGRRGSRTIIKTSHHNTILKLIFCLLVFASLTPVLPAATLSFSMGCH